MGEKPSVPERYEEVYSAFITREASLRRLDPRLAGRPTPSSIRVVEAENRSFDPEGQPRREDSAEISASWQQLMRLTPGLMSGSSSPIWRQGSSPVPFHVEQSRFGHIGVAS